jgi:pilus assembly protein CpaB
MRRPTLFVVLAGLAAMLASVVVYSALKRREAEVQQAIAKTVQVVVASYDLPLGTKIEPGEVKMARWSSDSLPAGAYIDPKQVYGTFVKSSFVANEPIVAGKLFLGEKTAGVMPLLIPFGMRAVSVPVDEVSDIAGFVLPHTRVDVLVAISGGEGVAKPISKVVLQNIEVLAVAQEVEKKKDEPTVVKVVTLLVSPQEAERLSLASREGSLRLAMRNYNDNKIVFTEGTDVQQMLRAYAPPAEVPVMAAQPTAHHAPVQRPHPFEVEILRNGKSSESVSFVNEASLHEEDVPEAAPHRKASHKKADGSAARADASVPPATAADTPPASAGAAHDGEPAAESGAEAPSSDTSSTQPANGSVKPAAYAPTPKTIDVP